MRRSWNQSGAARGERRLRGELAGALKNDNHFIFTAASAAQKAVGYLDSLQPERQPTVPNRATMAPAAASPQPF